MFLFDAGFMMECSTWSGAESLNLQFMVPKVSISNLNSLSIADEVSTYAKKNFLTL